VDVCFLVFFSRNMGFFVFLIEMILLVVDILVLEAEIFVVDINLIL